MDTEEKLFLLAAQWAGQYALPLFSLVLASLLVLAWGSWWALRRYVVPRAQNAFPQWGLLALYLASGFLAIVAGAWAFGELADELRTRAVLGRADQALTDALQLSVPLSALQLFAAVTRLADTASITGMGIVGAIGLVALRRRWLAVGWSAALAGNGLLNHTLKQVFARARPLHDGGLVVADGYSFPSGHSSGSVVAFGMLAYVGTRLLPPGWHLPVVLLAVALAFTVGASRVFLRVHFASDVIAGFASGTAWLAVCIASIEFAKWYRLRGTSG